MRRSDSGLPPRTFRPERAPAAPAGLLLTTGDSRRPTGFSVLDEAGSHQAEHDLALVLWSSVRHVHLWASVPQERRADLFPLHHPWFTERVASAARQAPHLEPALAVFARLLRSGGQVPPPELAGACVQVSEWATRSGRHRTAALYAEAAAAADPADAALAINAGEACFRCGGADLVHRSEQWLRRALVLAKQASRSRRLLTIRAFLALGNWAREVGHVEEARYYYQRAGRRAKRYTRPRYHAVAQHNLFGLVIVAGGTVEEGIALSGASLDGYPARDASLPRLAHDVAYWMTRLGHDRLALGILRALPPMIEQSDLQLLAYGTLAYAAARAGEAELFHTARREVLSRAHDQAPSAAPALVHLAEAARTQGAWEAGAQHAREALRLARQRQDPAVEQAALESLARIASRDASGPQPTGQNAGTLESLAERVAVRLRRARPHRARPHPRPRVARGAHEVPAAPVGCLVTGAEADGRVLLEELESRGFGKALPLTLWTALGTVAAWVARPEDPQQVEPRSPGMLAAAQERVPALASSLSALAEAEGNPAGADAARVAAACGRIARWAHESGCIRTARLFAEAAAAVQPSDPARSIEAGEMCQRLGGADALGRAEQWFQRAFGQAANAPRRKLMTIRALMAWGNWARETGRSVLARTLYKRAARRALRSERWRYYAKAQHNLFGLVIVTGRGLKHAAQYVRAALNHYPARGDDLFRLAHDAAYFLIQRRLYTHALELLVPLQSHYARPDHQMLGHATTARAAAGAGRLGLFRAEEPKVLERMDRYEEFAAAALIHLAEGAAVFRLWDDAERYARRALEVALRREGTEAARAEDLLRQIAARAAPPPEAVPPPGLLREMESLVRLLRLRLLQPRRPAAGERA